MANPWVNFQDLMAGGGRMIAQVISTDASGSRVSVKQVGSDDTVLVEGNGSSYTNGGYVYVENNIIVGSAPTVRSVVTELLY